MSKLILIKYLHFLQELVLITLFLKCLQRVMNIVWIKKIINITFINTMKPNNCSLFKHCYKCHHILKFPNSDIVSNISNICYNCSFNEKPENAWNRFFKVTTKRTTWYAYLMLWHQLWSCVGSYIRGNLYNPVSFNVSTVNHAAVKISFCYSQSFIDKLSLFC